jgi:hypothetical protein
MKKILSIISLVASVLFANAQITLSTADFGTVGFVGVQNNDTLPNSLNVGNPGPLAQLWNFTALHNHYEDTIKFLPADTTQFALSFPNANIAITQTDLPGFYNYIFSNALAIRIEGEGLPTHIFTQTTPAEAVVYNPPQTYLTFPSTYNTGFAGGTKYTYTVDTTFIVMGHTIDTIQYRFTIRDTSHLDAWGTMTTPLGSFSSLRQKYIEHRTDSVWAHNDTLGWQFAGTTKDSTLIYRWFANAENIAIVEITMDSNWAVPKKAVWLNATPTSVPEIVNQNGIIIYPNPASSDLNITKSNDNEEYILIYDMMGRLVSETLLTDKTTKLNTSTYSTGLYSYRILDSSKVNTLNSGKFIINN